jgi:hypothetical protein
MITKEKRMKRMFVFMAAAVFVICMGTGAFAQEKKGEAAPKKAAASSEKPKAVKESLITRTATVVAIDLKTRVVTLKDKDGNVADLQVSEKAQNLPQVKVGDQVTAKFYESIAVELADPGTAMGTSASESAAKAKLGEKPAGIEATLVTVVANIEAIDWKKNVATLKGPEGKVVTVKIEDPKKWQSAKVGDKLRITYTQALAVEVKKVEKKEKK